MGSIKGLSSAYQTACELVNATNFYDWILPGSDQNSFHVGQICSAPVWFEKRTRWYFVTADYKPHDEPNSTWRAIKYSGSGKDFEADTHVKKHFEVEKDENLIATHGKIRPVVLMKQLVSNWLNPKNQAQHSTTWLCLPAFSYKDRHVQSYVIADQKLSTSDRFYLPPAHDDHPGIDEESALHLQTLQAIDVKYLKPLKCLCRSKQPEMQRPFRLSNFSMKLLQRHTALHIGCAEGTSESYDEFKEVIDLIFSEAKGT